VGEGGGLYCLGAVGQAWVSADVMGYAKSARIIKKLYCEI
jgi:hypothetical protein